MQELEKPINVFTYLSDDNNRTVAWAITDNKQEQITKWQSIVDLGEDPISEDVPADLVEQQIYLITAGTEEYYGDITLNLAFGALSSGSCSLLNPGFVSVESQEQFDSNSLTIRKNGVALLKTGLQADVSFVSSNVLVFAASLDKDDWISISRHVGA